MMKSFLLPSKYNSILKKDSLCIDPYAHDEMVEMALYHLNENHIFQAALRLHPHKKLQKFYKRYGEKFSRDPYFLQTLFALVAKIDREEHDTKDSKIVAGI